jgi:BirA family transcriptional regulator, biotin operon repressor / biotin---[acetyl-CoA-carboxylase] ligase
VHWSAEALWQAIEPLLPGFSVEILPEVASTNTELMRRARLGRADPMLLVAERQTAGRGRLGRSWSSHGDGQALEPHASLTFSLGLQLAPLNWSGLSLAVGLAVAHSLHPDVQLKWPNDLWVAGRKLGGILIETVAVEDVRYAVIGIGLNIQLPTEQDLRTPAAALCELLPEVNAAQALERIALPLVQTVLRFASEGFAPLRNAYRARDLLLGREVLCTDGTEGVAQGVDGDGALLLQTAQGMKKISSAEVSVRPLAPVVEGH